MAEKPYKTDYNATVSGWGVIGVLCVIGVMLWVLANGYEKDVIGWGIILIPVFFGLRFLYSLFKLDRHFS
jgi:hypothetical protein